MDKKISNAIIYCWSTFVIMFGLMHLYKNINKLTVDIIGFSACVVLLGLALLSRRNFIRKTVVLVSLLLGLFFIYWTYLVFLNTKEMVYVLNSLKVMLFFLLSAYVLSRPSVKSQFK